MEMIAIQPGLRKGKISLPFSKSHLHRLLIAGYLADKKYPIDFNSASDDIKATLQCIEALKNEKSIPELNCLESASTLRFLMPVAMTRRSSARFICSKRLAQRPISPLIQMLQLHGISCQNEGEQITLNGRLQPGIFTLPGNISSQFVTGLLFALPLLPQESHIELTSPLESKGYVDMTIEVLRTCGIKIETTANGYTIPGEQRYYLPQKLMPERDWSSAAVWLIMNHLGSSIKMEGLNTASLQPDSVLPALLKKLGTTIDISQCPDLFPAISIAAGRFPGTTTFTGIQRLRIKESDRLSAMTEVLSLFGVKSELTDSTFKIIGKSSPFQGNITIPSFGDHRIAMAAAAGATIASAPVSILQPECVSKSYPAFFSQLSALEN